MSNTLKVLFWLHRSKVNNQGNVPIQIRLTFQSQRADKATGYYVIPKRWNTKRQRVKGSIEGEQEINVGLDNLYNKSKILFSKAQVNGDVYLPKVMAELFAKQQTEPTLMISWLSSLLQEIPRSQLHIHIRNSSFEKNAS